MSLSLGGNVYIGVLEIVECHILRAPVSPPHSLDLGGIRVYKCRSVVTPPIASPAL